MKTVLKVGQKINIYRPSLIDGNVGYGVATISNPSGEAELEGIATLVRIVRKNHACIPPFETWIVKFDDDEEPVRRDIHVRLPQTAGMASSLARSPEGRNLLAFAAAAGLSDDWADPSGHGVTAWVNGNVLNNGVGAVELAGRQVNDELLVHLECAGAKVILNLNTLLALASSYVRQQYDIATEAVQNL